jgi:hypothetical protein
LEGCSAAEYEGKLVRRYQCVPLLEPTYLSLKLLKGFEELETKTVSHDVGNGSAEWACFGEFGLFVIIPKGLSLE